MLERLSDWRTRRRLRKSYEIRDDLFPGVGSSQPIRISKGKYKGVVYVYGEVSLEEGRPDGYVPLRFQYRILDAHGNTGVHPDTSETNPEWTTLIGDVLVDLMSRDDIEKGTMDDYSNGDDDPKQFAKV